MESEDVEAVRTARFLANAEKSQGASWNGEWGQATFQSVAGDDLD